MQLNLTLLESSFTGAIDGTNFTLTSKDSDASAFDLTYHYQCTSEGGSTGDETVNAVTSPFIYSISWGTDGTTLAPLVSYEIKNLTFLVNVDSTKNCTPPQIGFSDYVSALMLTSIKAKWDPLPQKWSTSGFANNFQFSMLNAAGTLDNFELVLSNPTVTPPTFSINPVAFKYTYAVNYIAPSELRETLEQRVTPTKPQALKATQPICVLMDASLIYNITGGAVQNMLKDPFTIDISNIPKDASFPFPSMELREMYLINPSKVNLEDARNKMNFVCTITPPASYMMISSVSYTLQASCVINQLDAQGNPTVLWTDTFSIASSASVTAEKRQACGGGAYAFNSTLYPTAAATTTTDTTTGETLDAKVLAGF